MKESNISYKAAKEELEETLAYLESKEINVDELSDKVKRASELFQICKTKLTNTEEEVQKILKNISTES
ncbi:MAG: exodeoxyribonuclease VII small subunit [Bacteroidales bacterium]